MFIHLTRSYSILFYSVQFSFYKRQRATHRTVYSSQADLKNSRIRDVAAVTSRYEPLQPLQPFTPVAPGGRQGGRHASDLARVLFPAALLAHTEWISAASASTPTFRQFSDVLAFSFFFLICSRSLDLNPSASFLSVPATHCSTRSLLGGVERSCLAVLIRYSRY